MAWAHNLTGGRRRWSEGEREERNARSRVTERARKRRSEVTRKRVEKRECGEVLYSDRT